MFDYRTTELGAAYRSRYVTPRERTLARSTRRHRARRGPRHEGSATDGLSGRALVLVLVASFMVVLDFSIVNVGLPSIHAALGFSGDSVQWVVTAYAITFAGLLILGGRVADLLGRRRIFVAGLVIFAASSLVAGLSADAVTLVIARAVQGVGAALVAPASLALITARFAEGPRRTRALGFYGATASVGFVAGQVLGGVFVQYLGWASIFLVNVPVGIVAALLTPRLISSDAQRARLAHVDLGGALSVTVAVAAAVYAVSQGSVLGWTHPLVLGALGLTVIGLASFVAIEQTHARPLINLHLLTRPTLATATVLSFFLGAWSAGQLVVMSLYLQQILHDSPLVAGLVLAPQGVAGFTTGMFGSRLVRRFGMRRLLVVSTLAVGLGFLVLSNLPATGHYSTLFLIVLPIGFGTVGIVFGTTVLGAHGMANEDQGVVGGVVNTARQVGAAMGVAVLVAIAEGAHAATGASSLSGDRTALVVTGGVGLLGALVASLGARTSFAPSPVSNPPFVYTD